MEKILNKSFGGAVSKNKKRTFIITKKTVIGIVLTILSFFVGRVTVFQGINPVAIAFLSVFLFSDKIFFAVELFLIPGFFLNSGSLYITKYLMCIVIMSIFNVCFKGSERGIAFKSVIGAISIMLSGIIIACINNFSIYYFVISILESVLVLSLAYVLNQGISTIYFNDGEINFQSDDIMSLSVLAGAVVAGSSDIYMGNISIMLTLIMLIIMLTAHKNGSAAGCCAGILLSSVLMISGSLSVEYSWVFGITGAVCGITKKLNKLFTVVAFIFSCAVCFVYINGKLFSIETIFSGVLAIILFLLFPSVYFPSIIPEIKPLPDTASAYILRMKDVVAHRLKGFSESFAKLSRTFSNLSEKRSVLSKEEVAELVDDVYADVCNDCGMKDFCWKDKFYNTYQTFFGLLATCEKNGKIQYYDMPAEFRRNCINSDFLAAETNRLFERYKLNLIWKNKIAESRTLMSKQISSISHIINCFSSELMAEFSFNDEMSKKIMNALTENGISVYSVAVTENKDKKTEVIIAHNSCYGRNICITDIIPIVNDVIGKNMFKSIYNCSTVIENNKNICKLKLSEEQVFSVTAGVSSAVKHDSRESGDSHTFMNLGNGSYLLALSDGMGSGALAKEESAASVELFENFMEAGFDRDTAVSLINSVLVLKSEPKNFSTLDICTINLYTGMCEFAKIGACTSFIVSNERTEVINSSTLPIGMLAEVDMQKDSFQLSDGDVIVMVTDGIADCFKNNELQNLIETSKNKEPNTLSEIILSTAKDASDGVLKDDMTVLTAKVRKR